ncbi:MAG: PP2C family protein-serine/threonine phosphatase [bacterium]
MTLLVVSLLTTLFSRAYSDMILKQEQERNAAGFETVSSSVSPLITSSITEVKTAMSDERVTSYIRLQYASPAELIHARIDCRDFLKAEIARSEGIFGLLFMRQDESIFGVLPEGNFFLDDPEVNPLPKNIRKQILAAPRGQTLWAGPISGADLYGFETSATPQSLMAASWKSVDVTYGECYAVMLMDVSVFEQQFASLEDRESIWHIFAEDMTEIYHTGENACRDPEKLIRQSGSGQIFRNENGESVCAFSMTMASPAWTLVREVSMENYEQVIHSVRRSVWLIAGVVFLIALVIYRFWLKKFMEQFNTLQRGIIRMGEGELQPAAPSAFTIGEFETMQLEIDRTSLALNEQMDTIRRMERERMEQENLLRAQEQLVKELSTARQIQRSVLPHIFPPFPDREEIDLYASMDAAKDVGGDFYDFFFIDEDHLCLVIADVSGKGIPAALFMMLSKRILEDFARQDRSPSLILEKTNDLLCESNQAEMFVTVWLGILEISTGLLTAANAGHEFPAIRKKDGPFELYKDRHGFVIGGMEGVRYREYSVQMAAGDKFFVYTDGVPEATAAGMEMFGTDRMISALNACKEKSPEEILSGMKSAVDAFVGDAEQFDDMTMMCLEYRGPRPAEPQAES